MTKGWMNVWISHSDKHPKCRFFSYSSSSSLKSQVERMSTMFLLAVLIIFVFFCSLHLTHIVNILSVQSEIGMCIRHPLCKLCKEWRWAALVRGSSVLLFTHTHLCGFWSSHVHFLIAPPVIYCIVLLCLWWPTKSLKKEFVTPELFQKDD